MFKRIKEYIHIFRLTRILPPVVTALVAIVTIGTAYAVSDNRSHLIWVIGAAIYFLLALLYILFFRRFAGNEALENDTVLSNMTLDLMVKMDDPVLICNEAGSIIWYNSALVSHLGKKNITGVRFEAFAGLPLSDVKTKGDAGMSITLENRNYTVKYYPVASKSKRYALTLWQDRTELDNALLRLSNEETLVAHVMVDNLEELGQYAKEGTRAAAN